MHHLQQQKLALKWIIIIHRDVMTETDILVDGSYIMLMFESGILTS